MKNALTQKNYSCGTDDDGQKAGAFGTFQSHTFNSVRDEVMGKCIKVFCTGLSISLYHENDFF
jgi:hypothetical protein